MDYSVLLQRAKNIIITPQKELLKIGNNIEDKKTTITQYALPLIIAVCVAKFIGTFFIGEYSMNLPFALTSSLIFFAVQYINLYIAIYLINEIFKTFKINTTLDKTASLIIYSSTPSWVLSIIIGVIPVLGKLSFLAIYSFFIFWIGLSAILKIQEDKKVNVAIISILLMLVSETIISLLGSGILNKIASVFFNNF